jgi:hypothetical protein
MTDREIKIATIAKQDPSFRVDTKSDDYLAARFDMVIAQVVAAREDSAHRDVATAITAAAETGNATESRYDAAMRKRDEENTARAKGGIPRGALTKSGVQA